MTEEDEKKLALLEKRLVANVDFNDQALNLLGFGTEDGCNSPMEFQQGPTRNSPWKFS
jgi:hypothetical protein